MSYIGNTNTTQGFIPAVDFFSGDASTTAFTLSRPVASVAQVQAVIENVPQSPGNAYTISGNTITFTSAPPSGTNNIYVYYTSPITQVIQPGQGTVGAAQLVGGTVNTTADIVANGVTVGKGTGSVSTNTAVGASALAGNSTGGGLTAVGYLAGTSTTASNNSFVGSYAGRFNTTGTNNVAVGSDNASGDPTFYNNTSGAYNTAIGTSALAKNTTASRNVAVGYQTAYANTTGTENVAMGAYSFDANTTGSANTAIGDASLSAATTADNNTAIGSESLKVSTTGANNTAVGKQSLWSNTTASNNTAVGYQAGYSGTTGGNNAYFGYQAGYANIDGTYNVGIGRATLAQATTSNNSVAIGYFALGGITTTATSLNTAVGYQSGSAITTGSKNTILGAYTGNQASLDIRTSSNYIVLSDGDGQPRLVTDNLGKLYTLGTYANTTAAAANVYLADAGWAGQFARSTSALKYKQDIRDLENIDIDLFRPVRYKSKCENDDQNKDHIGIIADEVAEAGIEELVTRGADGEIEGFQYERLTVVLLKALQKQQAIINTLTERITALENK